MWFDAVSLALLGALVLAGALRGALAAGFGLLALLGAYAAAAVLAPAVGAAAADALGLPGLLGLAVAGACVFVGAFAAIAGVGALLRALERSRRGDDPRSTADRALGACFGALRGALLVGLLAYAMTWLQALEAVGGAAGVPTAEGSAVVTATQSVIETTATALVGDESAGGRFAVRAAAHPAETFGALQALLDDPRIQGLREDPDFWTAVEAGRIDAALNRVSFLAIAYAADLRGELADLGLVEAGAADDPAQFRDEVEAALAQVAPRIRNLRSDPELQRLAEDPEVARLVQSGDTLGLLRHPGFRRLVDRLTSATG
jgi:membrane protein required for colicin V production